MLNLAEVAAIIIKKEICRYNKNKKNILQFLIKNDNFIVKFIGLHLIRCYWRYFDWKPCQRPHLPVHKQMVQVYDRYRWQLNHALQVILPFRTLIVNCKIRWHPVN